MSRLLRLSSLACVMAAVLSACAGEGPSGPSAGPTIAVIPTATSVRGGEMFDVTVRNAVTTDSIEVAVGGASAWASRTSDTTLTVLMPGGPAGSVTVQVRVRNDSGLRTATAAVARLASVTVSNPSAFVDSVSSALLATVGDIESLTPPSEASATAFSNDVAQARLWADSAAALLAALSLTDRTAAATLIANLESQAEAQLPSISAALRLHVAAANVDCTSDRVEAATCLAALVIALRGDIARLVAGGLVASAGYALLQTPGAQLLGAAVGVLGAARIGVTLASMYEKTERVVYGPAIFRALALGGPASLTASELSSMGSASVLTVNPNVPVALPLTLTTTNPLTTDGERSALVAQLLPIFDRVAAIRQRVMDYTADLIELPAAALPSAVVSSLQSPLGAGDVEVVEVSDPAVTVTIEDDAGTPVLRITGDPGEGKDLTVWIEADGGNAGWAELELSVRYEQANPCPASVTDIDGNTYPTVRIGDQCWTRENLRVGRFSDGTAIANLPEYQDWSIASIWGSGYGEFTAAHRPAWNHLNNDASTEAAMGRIYNWVATNDVRGICPTGWRVPTVADWNTLVDRFGGPSAAGPALRDSLHWPDYANVAPGVNASGFSARPIGWRDAYWYPGVVDLPDDSWHKTGFRDANGWVFIALQQPPGLPPHWGGVFAHLNSVQVNSQGIVAGSAVRCILP